MDRQIPLTQIEVPAPKPDEVYSLDFFGQNFRFHGLKQLLGKADYAKAGEKNAGLCARGESEREAARSLLSSLTLQYFYDHPLADDTGKVDSVMRVNYAIDRGRFREISNLTIGQFKDWLLENSGEDIQRITPAVTGVMAAAVAKILDTHELIYVAKKIQRTSKARTTLGLPGTLSSRLQPNHPVDDLRGITLLTLAGFSMGGGDALIGVNPAIDTVENISNVLFQLDKVRRKAGAPTQICVLSHVKTQVACLKKGAPVEIIFQSLAGTESTLTTEFDVSVDYLDEAYALMKERGPLKDVAKQFMYFETGQGSEFTYGKHNGIDMATTEALCYGLARRYDPFMVNNVTGFIGPETHATNEEMILSCLQDHFMGKLLGLPMGMAPCYTLHSRIGLDGQQIATQLLASAGANYYMDVFLNTDRMLAYFDTSGHDNQTLREIHGRTPTPEYLEWAVQKKIFAKGKNGKIERGENWGKVEAFCEDKAELDLLVRSTPMVYGFETKGSRPTNSVSRQLRLHQAVAREAVYEELDTQSLLKLHPFRMLETQSKDRESHLNSPTLGARLNEKSLEALGVEDADIQIIVSDGLSARAVNANVKNLFPVLLDGFTQAKVKLAQPILCRFGRVKLAESIAARAKAKLVILLIGERPGGDALSAQSLSAYLAFQLLDPTVQSVAAKFNGNSNIQFEYTVISNIYEGGLPPVEAGSVIVEKALEILKHQAAGNRLEKLLH